MLDWLEDHFPADGPVKVERSSSVGIGDTYREKSCAQLRKRQGPRYLIRIRRSLPYSDAAHWLLHEWAHCLEYDDQLDHGNAWALAYGRLYRADEARTAGIEDEEDLE